MQSFYFLKIFFILGLVVGLSRCDSQKNTTNRLEQPIVTTTFWQNYRKRLSQEIESLNQWVQNQGPIKDKQRITEIIFRMGYLTGLTHPSLWNYWVDLGIIKNVNKCELIKDLGYFVRKRDTRPYRQSGIGLWDALSELLPIPSNCAFPDENHQVWESLTDKQKKQWQQDYLIFIEKQLLQQGDSEAVKSALNRLEMRTSDYTFKAAILEVFRQSHQLFDYQWHRGLGLTNRCYKDDSDCWLPDPLPNTRGLWVWNKGYWQAILTWVNDLKPIWQKEGLAEFLKEGEKFNNGHYWSTKVENLSWNEIVESARSLGPKWCQKISEGDLLEVCRIHDDLYELTKWLTQRLPISWSFGGSPGHGDND